MTANSNDQEGAPSKKALARPALEHLQRALPTVPDWDAAGPVIFETIRHLNTLNDPDEKTPTLHLLESCCLRLLSSIGTKGIAPEILYVPPRAQQTVGFNSASAKWSDLHKNLLALQKSASFAWHDDHLVALLTVEGMVSSTGQALSALLNGISSIEQLNTSKNIDLKRLGGRLFHTGWFNDEDVHVPEAMIRFGKKIEGFNYPTTFIMTRNVALAFDLQDAPIWLSKLIAEYLFFPFMLRMPTTRKKVNFALHFELTLYAEYLNKIDTKSHFEETYERIAPVLERCGELLAQENSYELSSTNNGPPKIAFLLHSHSYLAHARNYLTFLEGLKELDSRPLEPITYINGNETEHGKERLPQAISERGSTIRWIDLSAGDVPDYLLAIRAQADKDSIAMLVFVSTPTFLITSARARIAPRITWWAMKYHAIQSNNIDGYLTYGSFGPERIIEGRKWRSTFPALTDLYDPNVAEQAHEIRQRYLKKGFRCLLACIGRAEKINHRPYLETVQRLLVDHPDALFLWTGRSIPPEVKATINELGISEQCECIGWIDTKLYAQVIDIYVDSYPFASGYTAYEAMAAGKPVVVLETPESLETSTATTLLPALKRESGSRKDQDRLIEIFSEKDEDLAFTPFVSNIETYEKKALRLMEDTQYREQSGEAGRTFVNEFLSDRTRMTQNICTHFFEIIDGS